MNAREADRYTAEGAGRGPGEGLARCSFDFNRELLGTLVDMSLKGFGIEIHNMSGSLVDEIKSTGSYMITLDFGDETIMAAVKNIWSTVRFDDGDMVYKGGVAIDVMSPEDRIALSKIIERMRSGS